MAGNSVVDDVAALAVVLREVVEGHRASTAGVDVGAASWGDADVDAALDRLVALSEADGASAAPDDAVDDLVAMYGLSPFERSTLVAAAAPDITPDAAVVYGYLHGDASAGVLSAGLALRLAGAPAWDAGCRGALLPEGTLARSGLVAVSPSGTFHRRSIVAADRVVQHLLGDGRLPPLLERCLAPAVGVHHPLTTVVRNLFEADEWFLYLRGRSEGGEAVAVQALADAEKGALRSSGT